MRLFKSKFLSVLLVFCLILQVLSSSVVFAENKQQISIDIGSKLVKIGDTSKVSIKLDKKYNEKFLILTQVCYDVTQETILRYNYESNIYEGTIKYEVEPECLDVWSIKQIKIGKEILDKKALERKGLNLEDYNVSLRYKENLYSKKATKSGIKPASTTKYSGYTVVLDPGHGGAVNSGYNWGGASVINDTLWEKDYNLDTSLATAEYLRNLGVNVILTRNSDKFLELSERSAFINSINPDLALSIHYNSFKAGYNGTRTYYKYKEQNGGLSKTLAVNVLDSVSGEFNLKREGAYTETYVDEINGLTFDYLHMIRVPQGNVALVECCYVSNAKDQAKVNTVKKRQHMGVTVAKGIQKTLDYMISKGIKPNTDIGQVQGLRKSSKTSTTLTMTWDKVSDCTGYKIFKSDMIDGFYYEIGDTSSRSFKDTGLKNNPIYYYKVKAYKNRNGLKTYGKFSEVYSNITSGVSCNKVGEVYLKDKTESSITIAWDAVKNASRYYVYRADKSNGEYKKIASVKATEFEDTGLEPAKQYRYKVRACRVYKSLNVYGSCSTIVKFKTLESICDKVENLKLDSVAEDKTNISWDEIENASGYQVYRADKIDGVYEKISEVKTNKFEDKGLEPGTKYFYKVKAYILIDNMKSFGKSSDILDVKTSNIACGKVYDIKQKSNLETTITISWNSDENCSGYKIYKSNKLNGQYEEIADITDKTYKDKKLASLSKYYYKVIPYVIFNGKKYMGEEPEILKAYTTRKAVITTNVYTRISADKEAKKLNLLKTETMINVLDESDGWYKILYNGEIAYVANNTATYLYETVKTLGTTTVKSLNVRSGAGVEYEKIGTLKNNQEVVIVLTLSNGWYKIIYDGKYGYVSKDYVKKSKVKAIQSCVIGGTNLRTGPSVKYSKIKYIKKGSLIYIVNYASNGWYRVVYNGDIGYTSPKYIAKG